MSAEGRILDLAAQAVAEVEAALTARLDALEKKLKDLEAGAGGPGTTVRAGAAKSSGKATGA